MSMFDIEGGLVEDESVPSDAASNLEIKPPRTLPRLSPFPYLGKVMMLTIGYA